MPAQKWEPTWLQHENVVHLCYELPHRVYDAQIYPVTAPNGSTIIIYGHDKGVTVLWRGGRPFRKPSSRPQQKPKEPDIIMIDDDDDDEPTQAPTDEFETEEAEFDEEEPFEKIIHSETIPTSSSVLHLAFPDINLDLDNLTRQSMPPLLREKLIVAIACADGSVRVLKMGISPSQRISTKDINSVTIIETQQSPLSVSRGLAMTWTGQQRSKSTNEDDLGTTDWSLLLASYNDRAGGMLTVHQLALREDGADFKNKQAVSLLQEEYLRNQITKISFNTAPYPARYHSQLLVALAGAVRIYEPYPQKRHTSKTSTQGSWLTSFHVPFEDSASPPQDTAIGQRKRILHAVWASNGQCIMVLLRDGQWGIWDMEGIAPEATKPSRRSNANAFSHNKGVSGGGVTRFSLQGYAGENSRAKADKFNLSAGQSTAKEAKKLTPMTPNTRKVKQEALFSGPSTGPKLSGLSEGGISTAFIPAAKIGSRPDESIMIWYEGALYHIPSLLTYWQRAVNGSDDSNSLSQMKGFSTSNANITNVTQAPSSARPQSSSAPSLKRDILVCAAHRLLMLCPMQTADSQSDPGPVRRLFLTDAQPDNAISNNADAMDLEEEDIIRFDQDRLSKGQLDLGGLDRVLSGMNGGSGSMFGSRMSNGGGGSLFGNGLQSRTRKVGFAAGF